MKLREIKPFSLVFLHYSCHIPGQLLILRFLEKQFGESNSRIEFQQFFFQESVNWIRESNLNSFVAQISESNSSFLIWRSVMNRIYWIPFQTSAYNAWWSYGRNCISCDWLFWWLRNYFWMTWWLDEEIIMIFEVIPRLIRNSLNPKLFLCNF